MVERPLDLSSHPRSKIRAGFECRSLVKSMLLVTLLHVVVGFQLIILLIKRDTLDPSGL